MRSLGLLVNQGILRQCGITLINVYVLYYPYFISSSYTMALFNHHKNYLHYLFFCFHSLFIYTFQVPSNIAQKVTSAYHHILFITFKFPRNYIIRKKHDRIIEDGIRIPEPFYDDDVSPKLQWLVNDFCHVKIFWYKNNTRRFTCIGDIFTYQNN